MAERLSQVLSGVAGEYYAAAELSRRGYIASITLRNSKGVDILATNEEATRSAAVQVKTNQHSTKSWLLDKKAETLVAKNLFYVFVNLNGSKEPPSFHVVPSKIVAEYCSTSHRNWLSKTKRDGTPRKDSSMRKFNDPGDRYRDAWDRLKL